MRQIAKIVILILVAGAILALVMYWVGFEKTWQAVLQAGIPAFLSTGLFMATVILLQAFAWAYLNRGVRHKIPFRILAEGSVVGQAGNILTPSTYLGGEPARILFVGKRAGVSYQEQTGTVLLGKYLEAISFVCFLTVCAAATIVHYWTALFTGTALIAGLSLMLVTVLLVALAVALLMTLRRGWTPLAGLLLAGERMRIFPKALRRLRRRTIGVEKQASRVFRQEEKLILPAVVVYLATHAAMYLKPLAFFVLGYGLRLDFYELSLIFVVCQVLLAFQLTPSGVGTLDGGMFGMLSLAGLGISSPQCAAYLLSLRFWDFATVALGAALAGRVGAGLLTKAPEPAGPADPPAGPATPPAQPADAPPPRPAR